MVSLLHRVDNLYKACIASAETALLQVFPVCSLLNLQMQNLCGREPSIPLTGGLEQHITFLRRSEAKVQSRCLGGALLPPGFQMPPFSPSIEQPRFF